jgi:hypothetical protein
MAVMAPVHPRGHKTPVLVAGDQQDDVTETLERLAFAWRSVIGEEVGAATSIKMIRSRCS